MSELPVGVIRARLEQLGELEARSADEVVSGVPDEWDAAYLAHARISVFDDDFDFYKGDEPDDAIRGLWARLSKGAHLTGRKFAFWWDARIQDWGTSPNAQEGWPREATDVEDIRMRLAQIRDRLLPSRRFERLTVFERILFSETPHSEELVRSLWATWSNAQRRPFYVPL